MASTRPANSLASAIALAAMLVLAGRASAQPKVDHEARGYDLATGGHFDEALHEFEEAYRLTSAPQLLFAMGRMHALLGDCVRAKDHFNRFLATQPGPKAGDAAQAEIDRCKPKAAPPPPPPPPPPDVAPPPPEVTPPPPVARASTRSLPRAIVSDRLVQVGAAAGVVGAGLLVYSMYLSCWDGVCEGSYDDYKTRRGRAPYVGGAAIGFGAVAGALIISGVVRQSLRGGDDNFEVSVAPRRGGGIVGVRATF